MKRFSPRHLSAAAIALLLIAAAAPLVTVTLEEVVPDGVGISGGFPVGTQAVLRTDPQGNYIRSSTNGYYGTTLDGSKEIVIPAPIAERHIADTATNSASAPETDSNRKGTGQAQKACEVRSSAPRVELPTSEKPPTASNPGAPGANPATASQPSGAAPGTSDPRAGTPSAPSGIYAGSGSGTGSQGSSNSPDSPNQRADDAPLSGRVPASSSDFSPSATRILPQLREAANEVNGAEIVKGATQMQRQLQRDALSDYNTLRTSAKFEIEQQSKFTQTPLDAAENVLKKAQSNLQEFVNTVGEGKGGLPDGNKNAILLPLENARDKVALALSDLGQEKLTQDPLGNLPMNPFRGLGSLGPVSSNPFAITPALGAIFNSEAITLNNATTPDALVDRTIFMASLSPEARKRVLAGLKLIETPSLALADGSERKIPILHNGYIFGGSKTGIDCSSFVSRLLPPSLRQFRFTTLDFWAIWNMKKQGALPRPPAYPPAHAEQLKLAASAFTAIDIYEKQTVTTGDLLVYRLPWDPVGHVFLVKSYNPRKQTVEVIEAAQSAGTIREREFPLTINPQSKILRPGLMGLRIKPVDNAVCTYKNPGADRRSASTLEKGGAQ